MTSARRPHHLYGLLARAERLAARQVREVLDEQGCTVEAWRVMSQLADGEGHRMSAIAEQALLPPPTLTRLMDQLVDDGLVHRRIDPMDRRRILAYLTPRGEDYWQRLDERVRERWAALPGSGDDELLAVLLDRLIAGLDLPRETAEAGPPPTTALHA
ncbi:MarR family winged helix-turn-helix transcriptional regulator [Streptomyces aidingensis]|uniref:DNA-binding transcriptional regulator, MarR family n=1 Tax=Streptomyces aidingensis TaxID=910347 RepID=A0A1I1S2I3_9ACTN|nr:MarR family transcriptional regulator [Streptomyces aidingensis]SFD40709.1 DNA-binding transcriptional regulator, MarR family [Streptomyces aidingensis]